MKMPGNILHLAWLYRHFHLLFVYPRRDNKYQRQGGWVGLLRESMSLRLRLQHVSKNRTFSFAAGIYKTHIEMAEYAKPIAGVLYTPGGKT